ncbi:MAG: VCBS repeat-containing protein, partial [Planctomycetes bacterium]|nr:VCBS repeat-containing protein [Planctomycetota bacterium]
MKKFLTIAASIVALLAILISAIVFYIQGPPVTQGKTDLKFKEIEFPYEHKADLENALPFMGLATVDLDGDGVDEIFVGSGSGQADELFRFDGSGFSLISTPGTFTKGSNETTFGAASIDTTGDGLDELFVARDSGVYYYQNLGSNKFAEQRIDFGLEDNTIPLSIALGDINLDGWVDLYISGYIKPELVEGETNFDPTYGGYSHLLLNRGNNSWQQITKSAGLYRQHNTFLAMFIDLNNDEWPDLVVAQDTGVVEIWRNLGNLTFKREETPTAYGYPMGIGAGDINNDGLVDLYLSNVGNTVPG